MSRIDIIFYLWIIISLLFTILFVSIDYFFEQIKLSLKKLWKSYKRNNNIFICFYYWISDILGNISDYEQNNINSCIKFIIKALVNNIFTDISYIAFSSGMSGLCLIHFLNKADSDDIIAISDIIDKLGVFTLTFCASIFIILGLFGDTIKEINSRMERAVYTILIIIGLIAILLVVNHYS